MIYPPVPGYTYEGVRAIIAGWGKTRFSGEMSDVLMVANVFTLSNSQCRRKWGRFHLVTDSKICAENPGEDACGGDSGGPLAVALGDGSYQLIGIISLGNECAKNNWPGIYTRVTSFLHTNFVNI